jgi:uncharacterized membrane protein YfcA
MTVTLSLILAVIVFVTAIISSSIGMAGGMILMGVLAWTLPVQQAMVTHALAQFFSNSSRAMILRHHIYWPGLKLHFVGAAIVFVTMSFVAFVPDNALVLLVLGISPFLSLALPKKSQLDFTRPLHAFLCGISCTALQLTAGVGPILDIFFQNQSLSRYQTVATKAFCSAAGHVLKFIYFGIIVASISDGLHALPLWLYLLIPVLAIAGTHAGKFFLEKLEDAQFYKITRIIMQGIGLIYLIKAFSLWLEPG